MIFVSILVSVAAASSAYGGLEFHLDFYPVDSDPDGIYENAWPLKANEVVKVGVYVSDVPAPGLISMGFVMEFDSSLLGVVSPGVETKVDEGNWPLHGVPDTSEPGRLGVLGFREPEQAGLAGDNILLATVVFRCLAEGVSELRIMGCEEPQHCFILDDDQGTVLDRDIPEEGIVLARIHPGYPGDVNGDGVVDLVDAILALKVMVHLTAPFVNYTADLNQDHKIGLAEAIFILQKVAAARP